MVSSVHMPWKIPENSPFNLATNYLHFVPYLNTNRTIEAIFEFPFVDGEIHSQICLILELSKMANLERYNLNITQVWVRNKNIALKVMFVFQCPTDGLQGPRGDPSDYGPSSRYNTSICRSIPMVNVD